MDRPPPDMQLVAANFATTAPIDLVGAESGPAPRKRRPRKSKAPLPKGFKRHLAPSPEAIAYATFVGLPRSELDRLSKAATAFKWKLGDAPLADAMARAIRADRTLSPRQREDRLKRLTAELKAAASAEHDALEAEAADWVERVNKFAASDKDRKLHEAAEKRAYELGVQNFLRQFASYRDEAGDYRPKYEFTNDARVWVNKNYERQAISMARAAFHSAPPPRRRSSRTKG